MILCLQHDSLFESTGGVQYYLDDLLSLLSEMSGGVKTLIPQRNATTVTQDRKYKIVTVPMPATGIAAKFQNRFSISYFKKALELISSDRPSLLICAHVSLLPLTWALHKISKLPFVCICYGIESWGRRPWWERVALRDASRILAISECTKAQLIQAGLAPEKIRIVHPMLPSFFEDTTITPQRKGDFRFLTVGRLDAKEQYKGHDHVIEALSRIAKDMPNLTYTIHGEGSDKERLQELARKREVEAQVQFRPFVSDRSKLLEVYRTANAFIMPSRFGFWDGSWHGEGFGIVYLEAAALGVPSIAYRCGGVLDIIDDGKTGSLVEPDDIEALAAAMKSMAENPQQTETMGLAAREKSKNFSRNAIRGEVSAAFSGVV